MRIAVVGHGRMGREVEAVAARARPRAGGRRPARASPPAAVVGIDFTRADAGASTTSARGPGRPARVTSWAPPAGATGEAEVRELVAASGGGLVHAANFSLGVNLFYQVVRARRRP